MNDFDIQYSIGEYKTKRVLGEGRYATVFEGIKLNTNSTVAIKVTSKSLIRGANPHFIKNERMVYEKIEKNEIKCPNILKYIDFKEEYDNVFFMLEFFNGYTLQRVIFESIHHKERNSVTQEEKKNYLQQIGSALVFLHDMNIFHCDLKPENILIGRNEVKICDFGCAIISETRFYPAKKLSFSGTPGFSPPEVYEKDVDSVYLENVDTWAYTCVLFFIYSGKQPFATQSIYKTFTNLKECNVNYNLLPEDIKRICKGVFKFNHKSRLVLQDVIREIDNLN